MTAAGSSVPEQPIRTVIHMVRDNLDAHFAGKPVLSPIPG
jgi:hypothetical protein